jgi:soluble lytic murein transglycosylase-like protein
MPSIREETMSIDPANPAGSPVQGTIYNPMMPVGQNEEEELGEPSQALTTSTAFASIDKQFASLIKELTQSLSSLEKQLMQALRQIGAAPKNKAPSKSTPATNRGPQFHRYGSIISDVARRYEVDPQLVSAIINQESAFQPDAISKSGAMGLMQLMPDTAKSLGVTDPFNPAQNIEGGTTLLRGLLDKYHGQLDFALAAYNAGPAAVDKYGGVPPFPETQAYVRNIMALYREAALSA